MQSYKYPVFRRFQSGVRLQLLVVLWTMGIILGTAWAATFSAAFSSWMRPVCCMRVSIVRLAVWNVLPFVITAGISAFGFYPVLYLFGFFKGLAFGATGMMCIAAFGNGGWLIRCLLLFSQLMTISAIWAVWVGICRKKRFSPWDIGLVAVYFMAVILIDYFLVCPFLGRLLK